MAPPLPVYGLIPAAGRALRLGPLPCSKELLPVGFRQTLAGPVPKVAGHYLLESYAAAGIERVFMVLHEQKGDVPRYFGSGEMAEVALAYLSIPGSGSVPETLDRAYPFVRDAVVALGFPDVLFAPAEAYRELLRRREQDGADLVLGLFPVRNPQTTDMVEVDPGGRVLRLEIRPERTELRYNWLIAVWGPAFTRHLHGAVRDHLGQLCHWERRDPAAEELPLGAVIQGAIDAGLRVEGVPFVEGSYRDIGTPEDLAEAVREGARLGGAGGRTGGLC